MTDLTTRYIDDQDSYTRNFNGMHWACPGHKLGQLAWRLTWAPESITRSDQLILAQVIDCYSTLIHRPTITRNEIIRELRKGPNRYQPPIKNEEPQ